jgi:hypothetical protein
MTLATPHTDSPIRGLHASAPAPLSFAPSLHIRAFLLRRDAGNALIYSAPTVGPGAFAGLGAIARAYLNHGHEAAFGQDLPGVPVFVHEADRRDRGLCRRAPLASHARGRRCAQPRH